MYTRIRDCGPFSATAGKRLVKSQKPRRLAAGSEMDLGLSDDSFERTDGSLAAAIQHVCVDHRRVHICMAQELLDRANVIT
jgi:3-deoxy-D-arabino-heptulosonate 7-phosphate (DAHP) synthase